MPNLSWPWRLCSVCLLLSGCPKLDTTNGAGAAAGSGSPSTNCLPLDGVYRVTYNETSGTCGSQSDELLEYHDGIAVTSGTSNCQAFGSAMVSPCEMRRESTCALSDGNGSLLAHARVVGSLTETDANRRLEGSLEVTLVDTGGATCMSVYRAVAVKTR